MFSLRYSLGKFLAVTTFCLFGQAVGSVQAAYYPIANPAGLGANANISIAALGSAGAVMLNPFTTTSSTGDNVTFTQFASTAQRVNQGAGWNGNFAAGDALLWTRFGGPVTLNFSGLPLRTFGVRIQPDIFGQFTAFVSVLNNVGTAVATFNFTGTSSNQGNGSALFIGIGSDDVLTDFSRVRIGIVSGGNLRNFAFNSPEFQVVPEPSTYALAGTGMLVLAGLRRRRNGRSV
jgi:hypothetical protein